ncbi:hypothetical protein OIU79_009079 [Salix purpurea]|uniref:Uncharacterized protein n=1 Tax=Salix purpurea TaxID=77065 RepID=A0A9Q0TJS5_SALPP|nr:hypothetical protein OIU79_009079 [Salix purpurea]
MCSRVGEKSKKKRSLYKNTRESEKLININYHNRPENKSLRHKPGQDGRFGGLIEI